MERRCCEIGLAVLLLVCAPVQAEPTDEQVANYQANWDSLAAHEEAPDWFADSKLGIYFHWGVYSVPAYGSEWYPRFMFQSGMRHREHHTKTYGDPSEFGYHDFVPMFKAEHFDAAAWADLFKSAGARFAGPVAQHHDGFAMWASKVNPWNVAARGPKRDITGELAAALRERDMKLITTFHHARHLQRNADDEKNWEGADSHFPYHPDFATSSKDPVLSKLYGNMPESEWHEYWLAQLKEVIDAYSPDIIWFDSWLNLVPAEYRQEFAAYYLNEAAKRKQDVVIAYKQIDMPASLGILDIEQGGKLDLSESVWLTDITLSRSSWCYVEGQKYKTIDLLLRNMIDVWSKNGVVLLNVSPKSDGTIPEEQQTVLLQLGEWLDEFGEAVYDTRPFDIYGFGTAKADKGHFGGQSATVKYSAKDIRFTVSKDDKTMYMFFLGKPKSGERIKMPKLGKHHYPPRSKIVRATVLGTEQEVAWESDTGNFYVTIPDAPMNEIATVFKFELE